MGAMWKSVPHLPPSLFPHRRLIFHEPQRPIREVFWGVTNGGSLVSLSVPKRAPHVHTQEEQPKLWPSPQVKNITIPGLFLGMN